MGVSEILASVDREIALLKQVRALLVGTADFANAGSSQETSQGFKGRCKAGEKGCG